MVDRRAILETLPNPVWKDSRTPTYSVTATTDELTFLGKRDQPDFAKLTITYSPYRVILELKSFKKYVQSFAGHLFSYERLCNALYDDLAVSLHPDALLVEIRCNPRGGTATAVSRGTLSRWKA